MGLHAINGIMATQHDVNLGVQSVTDQDGGRGLRDRPGNHRLGDKPPAPVHQTARTTTLSTCIIMSRTCIPLSPGTTIARMDCLASPPLVPCPSRPDYLRA